MSADEWNKQDWIKDILAKSGTEIMEINDDRPKDIRKMVYYPALPLIVKSEIKQSQLCSTLSNVDSHLYPNAINIQQQQQLLQQQQQHHQILSNTLPSSPTPSSSSPSNQLTQTMLITQNQTFPNNIKLEHNDHHQQQQQQQQQHQHQHQLQQSIHVDQPINSTHTKLTFKCEQCNMIFGSKSAHTSHMKSHSSTTTASMQDNNYQSSSSAISPVMPTNGQVPIGGSDPYQCNVCKKTFAVPARLIRHYRTHTGERPFECEFCHKMFSVKENLQVHRRIHTKERPYKCEVCGRAFEHSGKLHRHMRIHTGERPHKCSVCNKTFIQSGQLVIHMRTHTGEKPYKCPVEGCGKGFTCSKQLKVHSRTHTGEKPYHCDICFRDFGYNHVLKLHRVQHYGSKCYKCTICDETFKSKKEMEAHIKGHANEIPDDDNDTEQQQQQQQQAQPQTQPQQQPEQEQEQQQPQQTQSQPPRVKKGSTIAINTPALSPVATLPSVVAPPVTTSPGQSVAIKKEKLIYNSYELLPTADVSKSRDPIGLFPDTPIESSSSSEPDPNTDNCEDAFYYNMYKRFDTQPEQQIGIDYSMNHNRATINPALLAAACIASRRNNCESPKRKMSPPQSSNITSLSPLSPISTSLHVTTSPSSPQPIASMEIPMEISNEPNPNEMVEIDLSQKQSTLRNEPQNTFPYEPLTVMRQQGYFAPAPVAEYRPSLKSANDIVRQVEAAIAGAEPLLTPPRSSTESPDRSSSPESDSMMMADRDMMTLPLRKRKLYLKDNQSNDVSPVMRMSSVIQYARAS